MAQSLAVILDSADGGRDNVEAAIKILARDYDLKDVRNVPVQRAMGILQRMLESWDHPGRERVKGRHGDRRKPRKPRYGRRVWHGEEKQAHITALGREHTRLERHMENKLNKVFRQQERAVIRELRSQRRRGLSRHGYDY